MVMATVRGILLAHRAVVAIRVRRVIQAVFLTACLIPILAQAVVPAAAQAVVEISTSTLTTMNASQIDTI